MPITILSPYSGRPVKVRDQDLERALRDEEGRIFYVVQGDDGKGYYASMTRKGSEKDQERYRKLDEKGAVVDQRAKETVQQLHDATGTKRRNPVGIMLLLLIVLALAGGGYVYLQHPEWLGLGDEPAEQPEVPGTPGSPDADPDNPASEQTGMAPGFSAVRIVPAITYSSERAPAEIASAAVSTTLNKTAPTEAKPVAESETQAQAQDQPEPEAQPQPQPTDPQTADATPRQPRTWQPDTSSPPAATADDAGSAESDPFAGFRVTASGLRYKTTHLTDGDPALVGCFLHIRYAAYTLDRRPLIDDAQQQFVIMTGRAIRALDEGLAGMRAGEQRLIFVPKGHSTAGHLPGIDQLPNEPFLLDVQLLAVRPGVTHIIEHPGEGDRARPGDTVTLQYEAWVAGKTEPFDSSALRGEPMRLTLGQDNVILGLDLGIVGMQPGETRLLTIPPYLAYGDREIADGLIPANAVLSYRITALDVQRPADEE